MQPTTPDHPVDAPPDGLDWEERVRDGGGATVTFEAPRVWSRGGWVFVGSVIVTGVIFISWQGAGKLDGKSVMVGLTSLAVTVVLATRWIQLSTSAATIDIDATRVRIEREFPAAFLPREAPLARVDYFGSALDVDMVNAGRAEGQQRWVESQRYYLLYMYLGNGERIFVAAFSDRECGLFIAQRLDMLTERAKVVAGLAKMPSRVVKPYRS